MKRVFPYLLVFALGAFLTSQFSSFNQQARISAIADDSATSFPLAVGTTWEYEGWTRQQVGQEQDPPQRPYRVKETVTQQDKAHKDDTYLVTIRQEEFLGKDPATVSTIGYLTDGKKYYRIENEEGLDSVRKYLYGDTSDRDIIAEISRTPTYDLSTPQEGCYLIQNNNLSSDYAETFCDGIGPISMRYAHHGTIDEYELNLVKFTK
jgi:hypothetical protein